MFLSRISFVLDMTEEVRLEVGHAMCCFPVVYFSEVCSECSSEINPNKILVCRERVDDDDQT